MFKVFTNSSRLLTNTSKLLPNIYRLRHNNYKFLPNISKLKPNTYKVLPNTSRLFPNIYKLFPNVFKLKPKYCSFLLFVTRQGGVVLVGLVVCLKFSTLVYRFGTLIPIVVVWCSKKGGDFLCAT